MGRSSGPATEDFGRFARWSNAHPKPRFSFSLPAESCSTIEGEANSMESWQPTAYKQYQWIVADPQLLGGKLAIRGTRLGVSLILECLSSGMSLDDIDQSFGGSFPRQALPEVLKVASEITNSFHVAA
jgi:uncharacterized protein (DUF433 family)